MIHLPFIPLFQFASNGVHVKNEMPGISKLNAVTMSTEAHMIIK